MEQDLLKCCDAYCVVYSVAQVLNENHATSYQKLWIEVQCELMLITQSVNGNMIN